MSAQERGHIGVIELGDGQLQPLLLLWGQRVPIAQDSRQRHALRVLLAQYNVARLAGEYTAQQVQDLQRSFCTR
jgi:hypothetical protein